MSIDFHRGLSSSSLLCIADCRLHQPIGGLHHSYPHIAVDAVGQSAQFTATGTFGHGAVIPRPQQDITNSVAWTSSVPPPWPPSVLRVVTGVSAGTTITASIQGYTGTIRPLPPSSFRQFGRNGRARAGGARRSFPVSIGHVADSNQPFSPSEPLPQVPRSM